MLLQSYIHIISLKFIVMPIIFTHQMGFFLIMKVLEEVKHLLQEKSQWELLKFFKKIKLYLCCNIYAKRDWGHAKEYVETMWKIIEITKT